MIDFHTHVLPKIDDGSKSMEMSIQMLQQSVDQGVKTLVATPHFYPHKDSPETFFRRRDRAVSALTEEVLPPQLTIHLGCELHYYDGISRMEALEACCILGTSTLLLEMPFGRWEHYMMEEVAAIQRRGIQPVMAHVERYFAVNKKKQLLASLRELGVYNQISADYFVGGLKSLHAMAMFRGDDVQVLGSDCHNLTSRPPNMADAMEKLYHKFGDSHLDRWSGYGEELLDGAEAIRSKLTQYH